MKTSLQRLEDACVHICICIYIERERQRERETKRHLKKRKAFISATVKLGKKNSKLPINLGD